jgi:transglutaminase-like putative cysteine protease
MYYSIRHVTRYRYDAPVRESVMQLYVQPKSDGAQRLQSFQVSSSPRAGLQAYTDHFGNAVYHFDVPGVHQELTIEADAEVEVQPTAAPPDWVDASAWATLASPQVHGDNFDWLHQRGV